MKSDKKALTETQQESSLNINGLKEKVEEYKQIIKGHEG